MTETKEHEWQYPGQEHMDSTLYDRYHMNVYLPESLREQAVAFLPPKGTPLPLSDHYSRIKTERRLPAEIYMPYTYDIVDVTLIKATNTIFRVLVRAPWNRRVDICLALEGDFEICTAFWASPRDSHRGLDVNVYEQPPPSTSEKAMLNAMEEAIRQSRPDDVT